MIGMELKHIIGLLYHSLYKMPINRWKNRRNILHPREVISDIFISLGRTMNWDNPQTLDEKIQWLKFNSDTSWWVWLSDKYRVREYVKQRGLEDMLVPLLGKWDKVVDIDWKKLPNTFIMKTNHGSADAMLCKEKERINISEWKYHFILALKRKYGINNCEFHYSNIKPCIIAEKLLDSSKQSIHSSSLVDYKVWCVNGEPKYIWVCYDRDVKSVKVMMYDLDWKAVPEKCIDTEHYRIANTQIPCPKTYEKMLNAARILANDFPIVRVDFYEVEEKLYFGELTFTAAGGFNTFYSEEFQIEIGTQIDLSLAAVRHKNHAE